MEFNVHLSADASSPFLAMDGVKFITDYHT
jgi:hypothetical protein